MVPGMIPIAALIAPSSESHPRSSSSHSFASLFHSRCQKSRIVTQLSGHGTLQLAIYPPPIGTKISPVPDS